MMALLGMVTFFALATKLALMERSCVGVKPSLMHSIHVAALIGIAVGSLGFGFGWIGPELLFVGLALRFGVSRRDAGTLA